MNIWLNHVNTLAIGAKKDECDFVSELTSAIDSTQRKKYHWAEVTQFQTLRKITSICCERVNYHVIELLFNIPVTILYNICLLLNVFSSGYSSFTQFVHLWQKVKSIQTWVLHDRTRSIDVRCLAFGNYRQSSAELGCSVDPRKKVVPALSTLVIYK